MNGIQEIDFRCDAEECRHFCADVDGGCMAERPRIQVMDGHSSGHVAHAICLTYEPAEAHKLLPDEPERVGARTGHLRDWNDRPGATN